MDNVPQIGFRRTGVRPGGTMPLGGAVACLAALAAFLCQALPGSAHSTDSGIEGDPALGAYLSSECVACHQASGVQVAGIPAIVGWPRDQFVAVMQSYRDGHRDNPVMHNVASRLTDEEIAALAVHFGNLKPTGQ